MKDSHTVLATDSSSIRISALESATHRPDKVLNMHFYRPVWQIPMVELMDRESGNASDAPPQLLLDKIERGEFGFKTGKGFYSYPNPSFQTPGWLKGDED